MPPRPFEGNSIEWGDGVYGVDAAARRWFGASAASLDARQSIRLAAVIINPRHYSPVTPDRRIQRRVRMIASRLRRRGALSEQDYREVMGLPAPPPLLPAPVAPVDSAANGTAAEPQPERSARVSAWRRRS